jgi:hypothetical protein
VLVGRFLDEPQDDGAEQDGGSDFHELCFLDVGHRVLRSPAILPAALPQIVDRSGAFEDPMARGRNRVTWLRRWLVAAALATGVAVAGEAPPAGRLEFDSEEIVIDLRGDAVEVTGTYHFRVAGGAVPAQPMLYPYPEDALLGTARTLRLEWRQPDGRWAPLTFEELPPRGVRWRLPATASDTLTVRTVYRQVMHGYYARYIVTTTRAWGQPLRKASFEVRLPPGAKDPTFSYPFRPRGPSVRVWTYEAEDFLPREDILVRYRR